MAISKEQFKAANARGAAAIARGPIARAARYDSRRGLIVLRSRAAANSPFRWRWPKDCRCARSKLTKIKISPNGLGLHWPLLDADLYVPDLSRAPSVQVGGCSRSATWWLEPQRDKAKASRENGKRGGRPKDRAAA